MADSLSISPIDLAYFNQTGSTQAPTGLNDTVTGAPIDPSKYFAPAGSTAPAGNNTYVDPAVAQQQAALAAQYDSDISSLNGQLGNLDTQQNIGLQNIGSGYNKGFNRLNEQNAVAQRNYNTATQNNNQDYLNTRGGIMNSVRANGNALQRLLGINGSGNSSAAYELAPYAASVEGTKNLQGAQTTYSRNGQSLDTNWQDTQRGYSNGLEDLNQQKYQNENSLKAQIAQTRAGLLDKIAGAQANKTLSQGGGYAQAMAARDPYQSQVNTLLQQIAQLGQQYANPILQTKDVSYAAPDLGQYSLGNGRINAAGPANNVDDTFAPVIAPQQRDQYGNIIQG